MIEKEKTSNNFLNPRGNGGNHQVPLQKCRTATATAVSNTQREGDLRTDKGGWEQPGSQHEISSNDPGWRGEKE